MQNGFGYSAENIRKLGSQVVSHLRDKIKDTNRQSSWTGANLNALREFKIDNLDIDWYPSGDGKDRKAEFLFDLIGYVQGKGILIAAESEWINKNSSELNHDFEKLLYVRSPIKLMICRIDGDRITAEGIKDDLSAYMQKCCSEFSPGELFIIYCVKWQGSDEQRGDIAYELQIAGNPMHTGLNGEVFAIVEQS